MEDQYRDKYRIAPARLSDWDYGSDGMYFVTICTKKRMRYFGEIEPVDVFKAQNIPETRSIASLRMTETGKIAHDNFEKIPLFHPYVDVDEFVVMPDHVHGIVFINKPDKTTWELNKFGSQSKNLASIIRGYKSSVTTFATVNNFEFLWQPRYYDRVIRSHKEYLNIKGYIKENPDQWYRSGEDFENLFKP
jgi:putative transposase